jgi:hypothetical protein
MLINAISMLQIISMVLSPLPSFGLKSRRRLKLAEFFINWLAVFEPWNNDLNKDESVSCEN